MLPVRDAHENRSEALVVEPDAHGQAALLLTESLIHTLVFKSALTNVEAVEVIQVAQEVKYEVASLNGESKRRMQESLDLLSKMARSFETDNA
jgi:hypothetical protein